MRNNIQKIEIDWNEKVVHAGDLFIITTYFPHLDWRWVCRGIGCTKGISHGKRKGTKENNQKATEILGLTPKRYAYMLRGAQWKLFIKPLLKYGEYSELFADKLCRGVGGKYNYYKLMQMKESYDVMEQYMKDGLYNLLPIAMWTNGTTRELKDKFGKTNWREVCHNSFSRNKLIIETLEPSRDIIGSIIMLLPYETTIIKNIFYRGLVSFVSGGGECWAISQLKKESYLKDVKSKDIHRLNDIFCDTRRMAHQLGERFNPEWSLKTMREKHDKYSKAITAQKYSKEPFDFPFDVLYEFEGTGYRAILLQSPYEIAMQGKQERHCVGSYANSVKKGHYLIYNIVNKEGDTESTLGIIVWKQRNNELGAYYHKFGFSQQYKAMNQMPSEKEIEFGKKLIDKLNEINYNEEKTKQKMEIENV